MKDLKRRLPDRIQLTSDGHPAYIEAVDKVFGSEIDYAMLVKHFGRTKKKEGLRVAMRWSRRGSWENPIWRRSLPPSPSAKI